MALPTLSVEFAPTNTPLAVSPTWVDITAYVLEFETSRGFSGELDTVADAGTATIVLNNNDRRFDPLYAAGPYFGNLKAGKQVRIRATHNAVTYNIFRGHAEGWPQEYPDGLFNTECVLRVVDGTQYLGRAVLQNDAVISKAGKAKFHRRKRKLGGFHEWMTRGAEGPSSALDLSEYSDLVEYAKPWSYWPVSGDNFDDTVEARAGDSNLFAQNGALINQIGLGELVQGDEYAPASMQFTRSTSDYFKTSGVDVPQFKALTVECIFQLTTLPSVSGAMRLVGGSNVTGTTTPSFSLHIDASDDINAQVRLTDGLTYAWIVPATLVINTTYYAALIYDSAAGTIGGRFNQTGGSGSTGAGAIRTAATSPNKNIFVGGCPDAGTPQFLNGKVQHVAIYNRVLTATTCNARYPAIPLGFPTGGDTSTRVAAILAAVSWPLSLQDFASGTYQTLIGRRYSNQSALDEISTSVAAEFGRFWFDAGGIANLEIRDWRNLAFFASSAATFGDGAGEMPYSDIGTLEVDDTNLYNRLIAKSAAADVPVTVGDGTSQSTYGVRALDLGEIIVDSSASASSLISALLARYKDQQPRFRQITIQPQMDEANLWPKALGYDLLRQITINKRPKGTGDTAISQASHIERIQHRVPRGGYQASMSNWTTTWTVSPR